MTSAEDNGAQTERAAREASAWFVRMNNPLATDADLRGFQTWLAADPRHEDAFNETRALWAELEAPARALRAEVRRGPPTVAVPRRKGRRVAAVLAMLAATGMGLAVWRDAGLLDRALADHATRPGERREVRLPDGTQLLLDGDTAVSQSFAGARREVTVTRGRVFFEVAPDPARPFRVHADDLDVTVLGTAFSVDEDERTVTVDHGSIEVATHAGDAVRLADGDQVRASAQGLGAPVHVDAATALAWRRGLIVLDAAPLSEVFDELGRMAPGRVTALQDEVRAMRLSGVFQANDPDALLEAIRSGLGLKTIAAPGLATLVYR